MFWQNKTSESSDSRRAVRRIFVTVGTTRFDKLVEAATSATALEWMASQGYTHLTIQHGNGPPPCISQRGSLEIEVYDFRPSLNTSMAQADLILSHAGAGTVMEAMRLEKKLVVVINNLLMDNHQKELAEAMAKRDHLFMVEDPKDLFQLKTWVSFQDFEPVPHKSGDPTDFARVLDAHLGFSRQRKD